MKKILLALAIPACFIAAPASAFSFTFDWSGLKLCNSGSPNDVKNPVFVLKDVPAGTKYIRFALKDRDAPSYNHGGGVVAYTGQKSIKRGAFKYASPCPPGETHTYEWTATAQKKKRGGKIARAKASRKYP
jgi:phosphatidylethanolamine-binding protein (PEBP) family uncharacterized protein